MNLTKCLKKMGLSKYEADILRGTTADYREDGMESNAAAQEAVNDYIATLEKERAQLVEQIMEKAKAAGVEKEVAAALAKQEEKPAEEAKVEPKPEEAATPAPEAADRDTFSVTRVVDDADQVLTFKRGEKVKIHSGSARMTEGVITGISHAQGKFSVDKLSYPFGFAYKINYDETERPRVEIVEAIRRLRERLEGGNAIQFRELFEGVEALITKADLAADYKDDLASLRELNDGLQSQKIGKYTVYSTSDGKWGVQFDMDGATHGRRGLSKEDALALAQKWANKDEADAKIMAEQREKRRLEADRQTTLTEHDSVLARARDGEATADELRAAFARLKASAKDRLNVELNSLTKAQLLERVGQRYKNDNKSQLVKAAIYDLYTDFALGKSFSYSPFGGKGAEAVIEEMVGQYTDADIKDYAQRVAAARKAREEMVHGFKKALTNPETLDEFRTFLRYKDESKLTPEQRAKYDELRAAEVKAGQQADATPVVQATSTQVAAEIVQTKHTQKGYDLWVVKLSQRVGAEDYKRLSAAAKKLGGWYSSYAKDGAIPGFQFKTDESAQAFKALATEGDTQAAQEVAAERKEDRRETKKSAAAERLAEMADRMEEAANDKLQADRLVNTDRRARMAASAEASARADLAMAKTLRNLSAAIESGEAKHLEGIRTRTQVETLDDIIRSGKQERLRKDYPSYAEQEKHKDRPLDVADADFAKWPGEFDARRGELLSAANKLKDVKGASILAGQLRRLAETTRDDDANISVPRSVVEKALEKAGERDLPWYWRTKMERLKRLEAAGITELPVLRAALREYVQFRSATPQADRVKELERNLAGKGGIGIDFFPTPEPLADRMAEALDVDEGMTVLEPSAGKGNLADAVRRRVPSAQIDTVEMSSTLREILEAKGYPIVAQDFDTFTPDAHYDRIIMNPPFSDGQDAAHIRKAYDLLKPGGRLVAISGEGIFFRGDKKSGAFREWLDSVGGTSEKLEGAFTDRREVKTTGVASRLIIIDKPGVDLNATVEQPKQAYAPAFYSALSRAIEETKQAVAPAAQWKSAIAAMTQKGVKAEEIQWSGVNEWLDLQGAKVTKQQILDFLNANGVRVEETTLGEREPWRVRLDVLSNTGMSNMTEAERAEYKELVDRLDREGRDRTPESAQTKFDTYTLPGGQDYRELLLTLPVGNDTLTPGEREELRELRADKELLSEEDYARLVALDKRSRESPTVQAFRGGHYDQPNILAHVRFNERTDAEGKRVLFIEEVQSDWAQKGKREGFGNRPATHPAGWADTNDSRSTGAGVPSAPFVTKTEAWVGLALKRMIRYAAENGFDRVAWTTGEQQAARYDLSKHISKVQLLKRSTSGLVDPNDSDPGGILSAFDLSGKKVIERFVDNEAQVADLVGKDVAKRLYEQKPGPSRYSSGIRTITREVSGLDLKIGGEGMRAFYDRIIPNIANDVLKKLGGGRVVEVQIGQPRYGEVEPDAYGDYTVPVESTRLLDELETQPGFDITPALRDRALAGLPLFQKQAYHEYYVKRAEPADLSGPPQRDTGRRALPALRLRASGIAERFERSGTLSLKGQQVRTPEDLATLAQIYRDPKVETFRIFFVKDGVILHETGASARLPGRTRPLPDLVTNGERWMRTEMRRLKADGYWLLHNHPSGDPTPSTADVNATMMWAATAPGFKGHVIIDSNKYAVVPATEQAIKKPMVFTKDFGEDNLLKASKPSQYIGRQVRSWIDVAVIGKSFQQDGWMTLIGASGNQGVRAVSEVHIPTMTNPARARAAIRRFARQTGSDSIWLYGSAPDLWNAGAQKLIEEGFIFDAVTHDAQSYLAAGVETKPNFVFGKEWADTRVNWVAQPTARDQLAASTAEQDRRGYDPNNLQDPRTIRKGAEAIKAVLESDRELNRIMERVNTQWQIAAEHPDFAPVLQAGLDFMSDISRYANEAADLSKDLLPRVEKFSDILPAKFGGPKAPDAADIAAVSDAVSYGTLFGGGSPYEGRVWTDAELRAGRVIDGTFSMPASFKPMTDRQIRLYRDYLASVSHAMREHSKSLIHRIAQRADLQLNREMSLEDYAETARDAAREKGAELELRLQAEAPDLVPVRGPATDFFDRPDAAARIAESIREKLKDNSEPQYEAARKTLRMLDELQALIEAADEIEDRTLRLEEAGYAPIIRFGRYAVTASHLVDGKVVPFAFYRYDHQIQANMAATRLRKQYPDAIITKDVLPEDKHKLYQGLNLDAMEAFADFLVDDAGNSIAKDPIMQQFFRLAIAERSVLKRNMHRLGMPGWSKQANRVLAQYIVSMARSTSANYHTTDMLRSAQKIRKGDLADHAAWYVDYIRNPGEEASWVRSVLANWYILGSPAFGAVNLTQPVAITAPYLSKYVPFAVAHKILTGAYRDYMSGRRVNEAERRAFDRAVQDGTVSPQEIHQLRGETRASAQLLGGSLAWRKVMHAWGVFYSLTEQTNRGATFLAAYRIAVRKGIPNPFGFAERAVNETQFVYSRANRSRIATGPIGAPVMTFKHFLISYVELAYRLRKNPRALSWMMLSLMFLAGIDGLPFREDLEDVIDAIGQKMGYNVNAQDWRRKMIVKLAGPDLGNVLLRGVSGIPGFPIDVAARLGMHNLIPGTGMLKTSNPDKWRDTLEVLGPAAGLAQNVGRAADAIIDGSPTGAKEALPKAIKDVAKGLDMLKTGMYRDYKGAKIAETTPADAFWMMAGFMPREVADTQRATRDDQQRANMHRIMETMIADRMARAKFEEDEADFERARKQLEDWNNKNPSDPIVIEPNQIISRLKKMHQTRQERQIRTAPPEIRGTLLREREATRSP